MNTVQNFIDNPTPETLKAFAISIDSHLELVEYSYPIECNNFWHFIFKSPPHLKVFLENIKRDDDIKKFGVISFNKNNLSTFAEMESFDPILFSTEQNFFLYLTNKKFEHSRNKEEFLSCARQYWFSNLDASDKPVIEKFYSDNIDNNDMEDLAHKMMAIYNEPCFAARKLITLLVGASCIFHSQSTKTTQEQLMQFAKTVAQYDSFDNSLRSDVIEIVSGYWSLKKYSYSEDVTLLSVGGLYADNIFMHKFIRENEILVEKEALKSIITSKAHAKVSKL